MSKDKNYLRSLYGKKIEDLKKRSLLKNQEKEVIQNLSSLNFWDSKWTVAAYQALPDEVSLNAFCSSHPSNRFVFPFISGKNLEFYEVKEEDSFQKNSFSVLEPIPEKSKKVSVKDIDIFLIPGRAFDRQGGRLGRGQAYYDRSLHESSLKIGIAFDEQIHQGALPLEEHDILMDMIVTGKFVLIPKTINSKLNNFDQRTA